MPPRKRTAPLADSGTPPEAKGQPGTDGQNVAATPSQDPLRNEMVDAAAGRVTKRPEDERWLIHPGTYNGGLNYGTAVDLALGVDDDGDPVTASGTVDVDVTGFWGADPTLKLRITASQTGAEIGYVPVSDEIVVTKEGSFSVPVKGVGGYVRAEFTITGTGPAVALSAQLFEDDSK